MLNRKISLIDSEYYHIYNRGNSKQKIFLDDEDYNYFLLNVFIVAIPIKIFLLEKIL